MSTVFQAMGSIQRGNAEYAAGMYNAASDQAQAGQAEAAAAQNEVQVRQNFERFQGQQLANSAANGLDVTSGSPLAVLRDSAVSAEYDALKARYAGQLKANAFMTQAGLDTMQAKSARDAGYLSATAQLMNKGKGFVMDGSGG